MDEMRVTHLKRVVQCLEYIKCSINSDHYYSQLFFCFFFFHISPFGSICFFSVSLRNHRNDGHLVDAHRSLPDFSRCFLGFVLIFTVLLKETVLPRVLFSATKGVSFLFGLGLRLRI